LATSHATRAASGAVGARGVTTFEVVVAIDASAALLVTIVSFGTAVRAVGATLLALSRDAVAGELRSTVFVHETGDASP
jgi:hypothetical protein